MSRKSFAVLLLRVAGRVEPKEKLVIFHDWECAATGLGCKHGLRTWPDEVQARVAELKANGYDDQQAGYMVISWYAKQLERDLRDVEEAAGKWKVRHGYVTAELNATAARHEQAERERIEELKRVGDSSRKTIRDALLQKGAAEARLEQAEAALRQAENLCGDVYLYSLREITEEQLLDTQRETLDAVLSAGEPK